MTPTPVNIHEAKTQLSRLLEKVTRGEEFVICRAGKPVARLAPLEVVKREPRKLGGLKGKIWMADDFDELPDDLFKAFNGEHE